MIRNKTHFVCEEHRVIERLDPHTFVKESPLLGSDVLIHVLHRQADGMWKVIVGCLHVDDPPPKFDY